MLCRRSRTGVPQWEQPGWACCRSWPTDPLSLSGSSALPRRASGGGKEGKTRGREIRDLKKGGERKRSRWNHWGRREEGNPGIFSLFEAWSSSQHIPALSSSIPPQTCPPPLLRTLPPALAQALRYAWQHRNSSAISGTAFVPKPRPCCSGNSLDQVHKQLILRPTLS